MSEASSTARDRWVRAALTLGWLLAGVGLFRYWDLTIRVEGFLLWTAVFIGAYAAATWTLCRRGLSVAQKPWSDVWLWSAILVGATLGQVLFPRLVFASTTVQTVALFRVLDVVLPLWILHRGVYSAWSGRVGAAVTLGVPIYLLGVLWFLSVRMPSESHQGPLEPLSADELTIRGNSERHVRFLSDTIGSRGFRNYDNVRETVTYLRAVLTGYGYVVEEIDYVASGQGHRNLQVTIPGDSRPDEIVIVGAHYDTHDLTRGADDNATGVAGVLELARLMADARPARTIRFVLFGTEEPPFFNTEEMGSRVYARRASDSGEPLVAMYSLEMLGYFSDEAGSQRHPPPLQLFFPHRGDFLAFVGNPGSGRLLRQSLQRFRETVPFPSEGVVSSSMVPGVELSDHASFWRHGFPAVLISDTGPFRNGNYHRASDAARTLDFDRMARVITGVLRVVEAVSGA